jgi:hypothetical protein
MRLGPEPRLLIAERSIRGVMQMKWVGGALSAVALAGCMTDVGGLPTYWNFQNRTDSDVTVVWHRETGEQVELTKVEAGRSLSIDINPYGTSREVCDDGELVFTSPAGEEVMRGGMTCNRWVIEASRASEQP